MIEKGAGEEDSVLLVVRDVENCCVVGAGRLSKMCSLASQSS